jgi:hypothetical protein
MRQSRSQLSQFVIHGSALRDAAIDIRSTFTSMSDGSLAVISKYIIRLPDPLALVAVWASRCPRDCGNHPFFRQHLRRSRVGE